MITRFKIAKSVSGRYFASLSLARQRLLFYAAWMKALIVYHTISGHTKKAVEDICGFRTAACVMTDDDQNVTFELRTDCEKIRHLEEALTAQGPIGAYQEISAEGTSVVLGVARETFKGCCAACATTVGVFKAMQVAAGLALPKDISIKLTKE